LTVFKGLLEEAGPSGTGDVSISINVVTGCAIATLTVETVHTSYLALKKFPSCTEGTFSEKHSTLS
jgi:hypothetical protein